MPLIETMPVPSSSIVPERSPLSSGIAVAAAPELEAEREDCCGTEARPRTAASAPAAVPTATTARRAAGPRPKRSAAAPTTIATVKAVEPVQPRLVAVGAAEDAVTGGEQPDGERRVVHAPPDAVGETRAEPVRDLRRPRAARARRRRGRSRAVGRTP